ncbi:MAG: 16S rRNA (guanine(966)-N(2))-methyltransferase RsmD [Desulfobacterium sp.]|jgi:16S rRNA (guanine966-N2)-methyltransferase|nr:16S rRNA (guanine(966)-N(2))-methyltransferase RsmD [Desulfobacterium sp.]
MRIIGGNCRGRKLIPPKGRQTTRPTSDRIRESIFNIISQRIHKARVLDLFAGTGALGMEALSRGADFATFVDKSLEACKLIKENSTLLHLDDRSTIIHRDLSRPGQLFTPGERRSHTRIDQIQTNLAWAKKKFDLVFMDPPYGMGLIETTLADTSFLDLLTDNALIVCEHCVREDLGANLSNLDIRDQREYGKTRITFVTLKSSY